ncbi:MAG: hypothetical protein R6U37_01835 [Dehalococcoidia bacterium]
MRKRVSWIMTITYAVVAIGAGIFIGYAIESGHASDLDSEIEAKDSQIAILDARAGELDAEVKQLQSDLEAKQAECDTVQQELESTEAELSLFKKNYNDLTTYYQSCKNEYEFLQHQYENLQSACQGSTVDEIMELQHQIESLRSKNSYLTAEVSRLENQLTPSPAHALDQSEVWDNPKFESTAWKGRDYQLREKLESIGDYYGATHTYIEGETDCNDMAVDLWNMLLTENIKSVIVVGNKEMVKETFDECDHAWLYVFDGDGRVIYLEPTTGEVIYGRLPDGSSNPEAEQYREKGFIYEKPSDLWDDLCPSNHNW